MWWEIEVNTLIILWLLISLLIPENGSSKYERQFIVSWLESFWCAPRPLSFQIHHFLDFVKQIYKDLPKVVVSNSNCFTSPPGRPYFSSRFLPDPPGPVLREPSGDRREHGSLPRNGGNDHICAGEDCTWEGGQWNANGNLTLEHCYSCCT